MCRISPRFDLAPNARPRISPTSRRVRSRILEKYGARVRREVESRKNARARVGREVESRGNAGPRVGREVESWGNAAL